jgi:HD-GYP domain-containing protein (c-di-GMP phosphodiesterase class II)
MLESVGGVLARVGVIVRASHDDYDGTGYADGLAGDTIPIEARICSACDAFSAMTTDQSYRAAMALENAIAELHRCAGSRSTHWSSLRSYPSSRKTPSHA